MPTDDEARALYGDDVIVSRKGDFALVHLDQPDERLVRQRTEEFDPDDYFDPDCPLCDMFRAGCVFLFDEDDPAIEEAEEILLE